MSLNNKQKSVSLMATTELYPRRQRVSKMTEQRLGLMP